MWKGRLANKEAHSQKAKVKAGINRINRPRKRVIYTLDGKERSKPMDAELEMHGLESEGLMQAKEKQGVWPNQSRTQHNTTQLSTTWQL